MNETKVQASINRIVAGINRGINRRRHGVRVECKVRGCWPRRGLK